MVGRIFDIQRFSVHDGPGIRTTVFLKGCPLRCAWCHNPEGLTHEIQVKFVQSDCIGCGQCGNRTLDDVSQCPTKALQQCGQDIEASALLQELLKDRTFYGAEGGVTFSGGECLTQSEFVAHMLRLCHAQGLHTVIDTSGAVCFEAIEKTIAHCDLYLYDIKALDDQLHRQYTGIGNQLILENLDRLLTKTDQIWLRFPLIPGVNDGVQRVQELAQFAKSRGLPATLIPYHGLGVSKYQTLGYHTPYQATDTITRPQLDQYREIFVDHGVTLK